MNNNRNDAKNNKIDDDPGVNAVEANEETDNICFRGQAMAQMANLTLNVSLSSLKIIDGHFEGTTSNSSAEPPQDVQIPSQPSPGEFRSSMAHDDSVKDRSPHFPMRYPSSDRGTIMEPRQMTPWYWGVEDDVVVSGDYMGLSLPALTGSCTSPKHSNTNKSLPKFGHSPPGELLDDTDSDGHHDDTNIFEQDVVSSENGLNTTFELGKNITGHKGILSQSIDSIPADTHVLTHPGKHMSSEFHGFDADLVPSRPSRQTTMCQSIHQHSNRRARRRPTFEKGTDVDILPDLSIRQRAATETNAKSKILELLPCSGHAVNYAEIFISENSDMMQVSRLEDSALFNVEEGELSRAQSNKSSGNGHFGENNIPFYHQNDLVGSAVPVMISSQHSSETCTDLWRTTGESIGLDKHEPGYMFYSESELKQNNESPVESCDGGLSPRTFRKLQPNESGETFGPPDAYFQRRHVDNHASQDSIIRDSIRTYECTYSDLEVNQDEDEVIALPLALERDSTVHDGADRRPVVPTRQVTKEHIAIDGVSSNAIEASSVENVSNMKRRSRRQRKLTTSADDNMNYVDLLPSERSTYRKFALDHYISLSSGSEQSEILSVQSVSSTSGDTTPSKPRRRPSSDGVTGPLQRVTSHASIDSSLKSDDSEDIVPKTPSRRGGSQSRRCKSLLLSRSVGGGYFESPYEADDDIRLSPFLKPDKPDVTLKGQVPVETIVLDDEEEEEEEFSPGISTNNKIP